MEKFIDYIGPCKHSSLRYRWIMKYNRRNNNVRYIKFVDKSGLNEEIKN